MRTTVSIDDDLLKEAKVLAASSGKTLGQLVEDALRESLNQRKTSKQRPRVILPTFTGGGLMPGVDLEDKDALWELLDQPNATP
jgi:hypothetical protein